VRNINSDITFSPDGHRIAYVRANDPEIGKYRLLTATVDGNDEKVLQTVEVGSSTDFAQHVAWSPSGNQIAYQLVQPDGATGGIELFDLETGNARRPVSYTHLDVYKRQRWVLGFCRLDRVRSSQPFRWVNLLQKAQPLTNRMSPQPPPCRSWSTY